MKQKLLPFIAAALLMAACNNEKKEEKTTQETVSPGDGKEKAWVAVDSATMMKAWMEYSTPGDPHKKLAAANGTWDAEVTSWMAMGAPPTVSKGSAVNRMVMDGRYQVSDFSGDMMGMPFNGLSTTAYDNYKKVFVSTWIDNMGTGIMMMLSIAECHRFHKRVQAESRHHANGHPSVQRMRMTVFDTHRNHIQSHLHEETRQYPRADEQFASMRAAFMVVVKFRQEVQEGETEKTGARESVEQSDVARFGEFECEHRHHAERDAGKQNEIIHEISSQTSRLLQTNRNL